MSILRITVKTFQSIEHANMFILMCEKKADDTSKTDLKLKMQIIQNVEQKSQVKSIREYNVENHMKKMRKFLSQCNSIQNSLSPKEVVYSGEVNLSVNNVKL